METDSDLRVPRPEQLLIAACAEVSARRVVCTSQGRGQFAMETARRLPAAQVECHFVDLFPAEEARSIAEDGPPNLSIVCSADLPEGPFDLAAVPVSRFGEAEFTRDILQTAYERLAEEGRLFAAVDNRDDKWLRDEMDKLFSRVTRAPGPRGVVYSAVRRGAVPRRREFRSEFAFRDGERLVRAVSRPGVFSHRQLDLGARALLEVMKVKPGGRVLDIGCGSGVVGLAAALRAEGVRVHAIDSNARAVQCTAEGALLNEISAAQRDGTGEGSASPRVTVQLDADGQVPEPGTFDLAVGNPPYYSHFQIAEIFLQAARRALRPGGRVLIVTKKDDWHLVRMGQLFHQLESQSVRGYKVVSGVQR